MTQYLKPLHFACIEDDTRPNMALIKVKDGYAIATNGYMMVKLDLSITSTLSKEEIDLLNNKFIHKEVWKEIHKCDILEILEDKIVCHNHSIKKIFEYSDAIGTFFDIENVLLEVKQSGTQEKESIIFNHKMLTLLGKIFEESNLQFSFSKGNAGTVIFPFYDSGMFAVLMPVMNPSDTINRYMF